VASLTTLAAGVVGGHYQADVIALPASYASAATDATTLRVAANLIPGQSGVAAGNGATDDATQRVVPSSWAGAACTTVDVAAANTAVLAADANRRYVQVCNNDPTLDDEALVNVGAASAGGARLNRPLAAGQRGDCQPFPPAAALVGQSVGAAATVTLSVCAW
jgi:hypothetical protein